MAPLTPFTNCPFCKSAFPPAVWKPKSIGAATSITTKYRTQFCSAISCNHKFSQTFELIVPLKDMNIEHLIDFSFTLPNYKIYASCGFELNKHNTIIVYKEDTLSDAPKSPSSFETIFTLPYSEEYFQDFPTLIKINKLITLVPFI